MSSPGASPLAATIGTGGCVWDDRRPMVVLIHGAGLDHSVWALQARSLARHGWNVAAVDLPGHGRAADLASIVSIEDHAAWLARLIDDLRAAPVALVGHSMGAAIALTVAARSPASIGALALLATGPEMPVADSLLADAVADPPRAHRFVTAFGHGSHLGGSATPGVWNLGAARALLERCPPSILHRDFAACSAWNGRPYAEQVAQPALVLSGLFDRMTPPRAGRELAGLLADALFAEVAAGHMLMAEAPGEVSRALRRHLEAAAERLEPAAHDAS